MTPATLAQLVEFTEAAAMADLCHAAPPAMGFQVEESETSVALFAPAFDMILFNRVIGLGLRAPASESSIESFAGRYRAAGVRNFAIQVSPEAQPERLPGWLDACDLHPRDEWTKMYRAREPHVSVPTDLRIDRIDASLADRFGEVACPAFGMPGVLQPMLSAAVGRANWHHYIAWDGATPAAVAALFVRDAVGWLGVAATLPAYRRRGAQGALMARRIQDGADLGCQWFATETGRDRPDRPNPSFRNMLRTGFVVAYHRPNFMSPKAPV